MLNKKLTKLKKYTIMEPKRHKSNLHLLQCWAKLWSCSQATMKQEEEIAEANKSKGKKAEKKKNARLSAAKRYNERAAKAI